MNKTARDFLSSHVEGNDLKIKASELVELARPKRSPIHDLFTWDDSAAAEKWRVHEARVLIRTYSIEVTKTSPEDALIHVPVEKGHRGEGYYTKASALVKSVSAFDRALGEAESKLSSAQNAVNTLRELAGQSKDDRIGLLTVAHEAMQNAKDAIAKFH